MLTVGRTRNRLLAVDVVSDPLAALVSLSDAKDYLNVKTDADDDLITAMEKTATRVCEDFCRRTFVTHNVKTQWQGNTFPMRIFRPPIQSVVSVTTYYEGTPSVEGDTSIFYLMSEDGMRPTIRLKSGEDLTADDIELTSIITKNGYGDEAADVPEVFKDAVKLTLSNLYDNPDDFVKQGNANNIIPLDAQAMLAPHQCPVR